MIASITSVTEFAPRRPLALGLTLPLLEQGLTAPGSSDERRLLLRQRARSKTAKRKGYLLHGPLSWSILDLCRRPLKLPVDEGSLDSRPFTVVITWWFL